VNDPAYAKFNAQFKQKHNGTEANVWGYLGLDALALIENAIKTVTANGGAPDPAKMREVIEHSKALKGFTSSLTIDPATHNPINKPVLMIEVKDGQFKPQGSYAPKS
jgi:branched-chain amino acid transport system substrate-binding protein